MNVEALVLAKYLTLAILQVLLALYLEYGDNRAIRKFTKSSNRVLGLSVGYLIFNIWWTGQVVEWIIK